MRVCLLIRALNFGGAQRQIVTLANGLARKNHDVTLVVFYPEGQLINFLDHRVRFKSLNKSGRWDLLGFFYRLVRLVRKERPEVIYSFLEESNIASGFLKLFFPKIRVCWGARHSFMDLSKYDWATWAGETTSRYLVRFVDQIIFNSYSGISAAQEKGYPLSKSCVIPNGVDVNYYCPSNQNRVNLRQEWGISPSEALIGIVGRLDPMKDHETFLRAAGNLMSFNQKAHLICIGDGPQHFKQELQRLSNDLNLDANLIWAGNRLDMPSVYNALDILVSSSSYGEGCSNVISEAMSCGIPCVVTDVGDSAMIVGNDGIIVPPGDPETLAQSLNDLLSRIQNVDHGRIRLNIIERFSVESMVNATEKVFMSLISVKDSIHKE